MADEESFVGTGRAGLGYEILLIIKLIPRTSNIWTLVPLRYAGVIHVTAALYTTEGDLPVTKLKSTKERSEAKSIEHILKNDFHLSGLQFTPGNLSCSSTGYLEAQIIQIKQP
jgi:hypothetical protein